MKKGHQTCINSNLNKRVNFCCWYTYINRMIGLSEYSPLATGLWTTSRWSWPLEWPLRRFWSLLKLACRFKFGLEYQLVSKGITFLLNLKKNQHVFVQLHAKNSVYLYRKGYYLHLIWSKYLTYGFKYLLIIQNVSKLHLYNIPRLRNYEKIRKILEKVSWYFTFYREGRSKFIVQIFHNIKLLIITLT